MKPKLVLIGMYVNTPQSKFLLGGDGGGTGFVGGALSQMLVWHGFKPRLVTRLPSEEGVKAKTQISWRELMEKGLPNDCHGIINLCGATIGNPWARWTDKYKEQVRRSRISTTEAFRSLILKSEHKPAVFVSSSAVGFYPPSETAEYNEETPVTPDSSDFFQNLCRDWEKAAILPKDSGVRQVTIRIGLVLGRTGGIVAQSFWPFFFGLGGPLGSGSQWFPWIHLDDLRGIFTHALGNQSIHGVLNGVAPQIVTNKQFSLAFASAMRRPCIFPMPEFAVKQMFGEERAKLMLTGQKVWPKRTLEYEYDYLYTDIWEAAMEFARISLSDEEMNRPKSRMGNALWSFQDINQPVKFE